MPIKPPTHFAQPANRGQTHTQNIPWTVGAKQLSDQMMAAFQMMYGMKMQQQQAEDSKARLGLAERGVDLQEENADWSRYNALLGIQDKQGRGNPGIDAALAQLGEELGMPMQGNAAPEMVEQMEGGAVDPDSPPPLPDFSGLSAPERGAKAKQYASELSVWQKGQDQKGPGNIQTFEIASGFGEEQRGTPEYQKAFVQFQQDIAQATHVASPTARFAGPKYAGDLRKEFNALPEVKDYKETSRKHATMKKAFDTAKTTENFVAIDQALITLFNKMTDPQSVVRESEYLRTATDLAIFHRIKGKVSKIAKGGAGLSMDDRRALMEMGDKFMDAYSDTYLRSARQYRGFAMEALIDPENVVPVENLDVPKFGQTTGGEELPPLEF